MFIISILIYLFQKKNILNNEKFLNKKNLDIVDNKVCVKPSINNPFMNPTIIDIVDSPNKIAACTANNYILNSINDKFYSRIFREAGDIYGKFSSERQYYTVPSTTIPNDQTSFAEWLYKTPPTCKENNGNQCYMNLYNDERIK